MVFKHWVLEIHLSSGFPHMLFRLVFVMFPMLTTMFKICTPITKDRNQELELTLAYGIMLK